MITKKISVIGGVALASTFAISSMSAQTIGFWELDGTGSSFLADSSGNGNNLTAAGVVAETGTAAGIASAGGALTTSSSLVGTGSFTIEAFVRFDSFSEGRSIIAGEYVSGSNRGWELYAGSNGDIVLGVGRFAGSTNGPERFYTEDLFGDLSTGVDYFIAATFDASMVGGATDTGVTNFFIQDLSSASNPLVNDSETITSQTGINDVGNFTIGGRNGSTAGVFDGQISSVRLSDGIVAEADLLVNVPEPGTYALLGGILALGAVMIRRRRQ